MLSPLSPDSKEAELSPLSPDAEEEVLSGSVSFLKKHTDSYRYILHRKKFASSQQLQKHL